MTTHTEAFAQVREHLRPVFENSPDGVYVWLDDDNKTCNDHLAKMFGYTVAEWEAVDDFATAFIAESDRGVYVWNYQNRVVDLQFPVTFRFRALRKDGSDFAAETDMIPLTYGGHVFAYHFVRAVTAG
ncbi:MAG: PAS domain S-box protein [Hamadaea sp.]|nr:PAS domain S-box protein [Hamadaea sp.]